MNLHRVHMVSFIDFQTGKIFNFIQKYLNFINLHLVAKHFLLQLWFRQNSKYHNWAIGHIKVKENGQTNGLCRKSVNLISRKIKNFLSLDFQKIYFGIVFAG